MRSLSNGHPRDASVVQILQLPAHASPNLLFPEFVYCAQPPDWRGLCGIEHEITVMASSEQWSFLSARKKVQKTPLIVIIYGLQTFVCQKCMVLDRKGAQSCVLNSVWQRGEVFPAFEGLWIF